MPPRRESLQLRGAAADLESYIQARGDYSHVRVTARGHYIYVEAGAEVVARAELLGPRHYGVGFRSHTGRWEPMPLHGTVAEIASGIVDMLGPYLEPV